MIVFKNFIVAGRDGKPMSTDITFRQNGLRKPLVIYAHGFNGFKDWGNFNLIAQQFAEAGFVFVKFNFSHNGTTPDHPEEFADLDAYAQNNYSTQLNELGKIIDWCVEEKHHYVEEIDANNTYLLGHSLGGGLVILKAAEDDRVKKIATWAAISECKTPWGNWKAEKIQEWKTNGVAYTTNSRTKQQMPLNYQLFQDYKDNEKRLNIQKAIHSLSIPILLCQGSADEGVPLTKAQELKAWQPAAALYVVDSDHVFGRKHPWLESALPLAMQQGVHKTVEFFKA